MKIETLSIQGPETGRPPGTEWFYKSHFWLAIDKNYLPIARRFWNPYRSITHPFGFHRVTEFKEVAKGLWIPMKVEGKVWGIMPDEKTIPPPAVSIMTIDHYDPNPSHPVAFFRPEIPKGAVVYQVSDGKVGKGYVAGEQRAAAPPPPEEKAEPISVWRIVIAVCAAVVMFAGLWWFYGRARPTIAPRGDA